MFGVFFKQKLKNQPLTIVGDGEQRRDLIHVSDVVSANILAATSDVDDSVFGQIYNVGTGKNHSVNEIADLISDNQIHISPRIGEARITLADNSKLCDTFGWKPTVKLEDWISKQ